MMEYFSRQRQKPHACRERIFLFFFCLFLASPAIGMWGTPLTQGKSTSSARQFIFRTEPVGARIYRIRENGERSLIGISGKPIPLNTGSLREGRKFTFSFVLEGFLDESRILGGEDFMGDFFPPPGEPPIKFPSPFRQITFRTDPSGAAVFIARYGSSAGDDHIGASGTPLPLDLAKFLPDQEAEIIFRLPGFHDEKIRLKPHMFRHFSPEKILPYPSLGASPVVLKPKTFGKAAALWLSRNAGILVMIAIILILPGIFLAMKTAGMKKEREKWKNWEALKADVDQKDPMFNRIIGNYVIIEKIGEGGMATVYTAVPEAGRSKTEMVAIKVLKVKKEEEGEFFRRFRREVNILRNLSHPNILRVIDYGDQEGLLYIITEWIRGETLEKRIPERGLELADFQGIFSEILRAFEYAHQQGIVHRDVKGENIMITENGRIVVMDFGLAKGDHYSAITVDGTILGTPNYIAPELSRKKELDSRADQYSLGVLAFYMLTGHLPFTDESPFKVIYMHMEEPPPSLRESRPDLPEMLEKMVLKMMEKEPEKRFQNPAEIKEALEKAFIGENPEQAERERA
jgi:hypothetical protein